MILKLQAGALAGLAIFAIVMPMPRGAMAEPFSTSGMITEREGDRITVTAPDGTHTQMLLTPNTKVVSVSGKVLKSKSDVTASEVITGLPVSVDAERNGEEIDAVKIEFKSGDLKTARQVEAGTAQAKARAREKAQQLQAQNDELKKRMSEANQYVEKASTTVLFSTGSAVITAEGKAALQKIASAAKAIKGYWISVIGYADTTGNPEANQRLSERRAAAVTNYLQKYGGVMAQRVLAADAMGDSHQVGDTASNEGKAQNRRVVVKVLTNKGLEGLS
jgi:outer membrane protein OmpA-like peptidoglycan-associated protein